MEGIPLVFVLMGIGVLFIGLGFHKVEEGHVGVYFRGGALLPGITNPGYHWMFPFITNYENVQVTVQTDKVTDIPCGTSGGVLIYFDKIEVVNRLQKSYVWETIKNYTTAYDKTWIFDKIHHEINQFCSKHTLEEVYITKFDSLDENLVQALQTDCNKWAPGMEIISIRVTKPRIPTNIAENYERMEKEKTNYKIAIEAQKVSETNAQTKRKEATINAQTEADVSFIKMQKEINETKGLLEKEALMNTMLVEKESARANATKIRLMSEADANKYKLTKEFLQLEAIHAISNNAKLYFGPSIPQYLHENVYDLFNSTEKEGALNK